MPYIEYILVKGSQEERWQVGVGFMCMVMHMAPHLRSCDVSLQRLGIVGKWVELGNNYHQGGFHYPIRQPLH